MVDNNQERMSQGYRRSLLPATKGEMVVMGGEITLLAVRGCVRCFNQGRTQPLAAFARLAAQSLAPAFLIARTHACPGGQVRRTGKPAHIWSNFRQNDFHQPPSYAGNPFPPLPKTFLALHPPPNLHPPSR